MSQANDVFHYLSSGDPTELRPTRKKPKIRFGRNEQSRSLIEKKKDKTKKVQNVQFFFLALSTSAMRRTEPTSYPSRAWNQSKLRRHDSVITESWTIDNTTVQNNKSRRIFHLHSFLIWREKVHILISQKETKQVSRRGPPTWNPI